MRVRKIFFPNPKPRITIILCCKDAIYVSKIVTSHEQYKGMVLYIGTCPNIQLNCHYIILDIMWLQKKKKNRNREKEREE